MAFLSPSLELEQSCENSTCEVAGRSLCEDHQPVPYLSVYDTQFGRFFFHVLLEGETGLESGKQNE